MKGLMTLVVMGSVAAVAIPLAVLLEWWSVRALLALVARHRPPKSSSVVPIAHVSAGRVVARTA